MVQYWGNGNVVSDDQAIGRIYSDLYRDLVTAGVQFPDEQKYIGLYSFNNDQNRDISKIKENPSNHTEKETDYRPLLEKIENLERIRSKIIDLTMDGNHHVNELAIAYDMYLIARRSVNSEPLAIKLAQDRSETYKHIKVRGKIEIDIASSLAKAWEGFRSNRNFTIYQLICSEVLKAELGVKTEISNASSPKKSIMPTFNELKRLANDSGTPITPLMEPRSFAQMTSTIKIQANKEVSLDKSSLETETKKNITEVRIRPENKTISDNINHSHQIPHHQNSPQGNLVPPANPFESFGAPPTLTSTNKLHTHLVDNYVRGDPNRRSPEGQQRLSSPPLKSGNRQTLKDIVESQSDMYDDIKRSREFIDKLEVQDAYVYERSLKEDIQAHEYSFERESGKFEIQEQNSDQLNKLNRELQIEAELWQRERQARDIMIDTQLRELEMDNLQKQMLINQGYNEPNKALDAKEDYFSSRYSEINQTNRKPNREQSKSNDDHDMETDFKERRLQRERELQMINDQIQANSQKRLVQQREYQMLEQKRLQREQEAEALYQRLMTPIPPLTQRTPTSNPPASQTLHPTTHNPQPSTSTRTLPSRLSATRESRPTQPRIDLPALHTIAYMSDAGQLTSTMAKIVVANADADRDIESMRNDISDMVSMIESKRLAIHAARSEAKSVKQVKHGTDRDINELRMLKHAEHIKRSEMINEKNKLQMLENEIDSYHRDKVKVQETILSLNDISAISHRLPYDAQSRDNSRGRKPSPPPFIRSQGNQFLGDFNKELNNLISMTSFERSYINY